MAKKKGSTDELTDAAHKVWLAGLGALATAGQEGEKLFSTLVSRGEKLENKVDPVERASASVRNTVKGVRTRAGRTLGSIQTTIDDSVSSALHRLGVPTRSEIAALSQRVEKLTRAVEKRKTAKRKPAKKKATRRTAPKKTTAAKKKAAKAPPTRKSR